jgi:ABC-type multidrug transport system fused ATPase/permease subunit
MQIDERSLDSPGLTASNATQKLAKMSKHYSVYSNIQAGDVGDKSDYGAHWISFSSIFAFTDKKHLTVLIPALLLTTIAGAIKPAIAIFLGLIFDELANFGSGSITGDELLKGVSTWCIALTGLGVATMLVNGGFFYLWLVFGEMQARSVRDKSFLSMMEKDMEWYDLRAEGIGSLLVRIQTWVTLRLKKMRLY